MRLRQFVSSVLYRGRTTSSRLLGGVDEPGYDIRRVNGSEVYRSVKLALRKNRTVPRVAKEERPQESIFRSGPQWLRLSLNRFISNSLPLDGQGDPRTNLGKSVAAARQFCRFETPGNWSMPVTA